MRSLEIGSDDKLIGTRDGLYYVNDRRGIFKMFKSPQLRANMILSICKYRGKYYIGTFGGGLYVFDSSSASLSDFEDASLHPVFMNGQIFSMTTDTDGKLWMATSDGLFCYEGKGSCANTRAVILSCRRNVYQVYFDSTHRVVCTENGMALISPNEDRAVVRKFPKGFIHDRLIRIVYEDSRHQLYFFTRQGTSFPFRFVIDALRRSQKDSNR